MKKLYQYDMFCKCQSFDFMTYDTCSLKYCQLTVYNELRLYRKKKILHKAIKQFWCTFFVLPFTVLFFFLDESKLS